MISDRSKYRFVTPPDWMEINGGILPVRDVADDGSSSVLRGEDACFLAEAATRMSLYRGYGAGVQASDAVVEMGMESSLMNSARTGIAGATMESGLLKYSFGGAPDPKYGYVLDAGDSPLERLSSALNNTPSIFSPASGVIQPSASLDADSVRRLYYDLRKTGFCVSASVSGRRYYGGVTETYSKYEYTEEDGFVLTDSGTKQSAATTSVLVLSKYRSTWGGNFSAFDWVVTAITPSGGSSATPLASLSGEIECYVVVPILVSYDGAGSPGNHKDAMVMRGVLDENGIVAISPFSASGVRSAVSAARSIPVTWEDFDDGRSLLISIGDADVIFYDPGIDTSSIDWTWTPQSN